MITQRSLRFPITLAVLMIVLLAGLIVGWVLISVFGALSQEGSAGAYWTALALGSVLLIAVLVGVVMYLVWSISMIRLQRRQANFLDAVTHELKSPITSLKLSAQTLHRGNLTAEQEAEFHRFMIEAIDRLDTMVDHVLDAARTAGARPVKLEVVDLPALVSECARAVCQHHRAPQSAIELSLERCQVDASPDDLTLIFRNLLDNALKYAGDPPQVAVTMQATPKGQIVTHIADNGPGIAPRDRRRVFERFVRVGQELERETPGTGLGLYIVRMLVRRYGGLVRVRDGEEGRGNVLEVRLPQAAAQRAAGAVGETESE